MKNFKFFRYLLRDKVDFIILLILIAFTIKDFQNNFYLLGLIVYLLGVMRRMGTAMDVINDNVTNKELRLKLGLSSIVGSERFIRRTIFAKITDAIFWLAILGMLVYVIYFN